MEKHSGFWAAAAAAAVLCGCDPAMAAEGTSSLTVVVYVSAPSVPADVLATAERDVDAIYRRVGVTVVWHQHSRGASPQDDARVVGTAPLHLTAMITTSRNDARVPQTATLGITPRTEPGEGSSAVYAFFDRIKAVSLRMRVDVGHLLGHVLAHEMGHALLPYNSHSRTGIMKATWDQSQVKAAQRHWLAFSEEEAALIRSTVSRPGVIASSASR
jgi:hypothetical protein